MVLNKRLFGPPPSLVFLKQLLGDIVYDLPLKLVMFLLIGGRV